MKQILQSPLHLIAANKKRAADTDTPIVSTIIIQGTAKSAKPTLKALHNQEFSNFETIIVKEGVVGSRLKEVVKNRPSTSLYQSSYNLNLCRARNLAAQKARGQYLLFIDENAWLHRTALGKLVDAMKSEAETGIAGPLILSPDGSLKSIGMKVNEFGRPFANRDVFSPDIELIDPVFSIPSSIFMIEKQLFYSLSGFDELCVHGLEDTDLCWRAKLMGRKTVVNPWSIAYHDGDNSEATGGYLEHRNSLRMLIKNYGSLRAATGSLRFVKTSIVKSFKSLLALKPRSFFEYWRALLWNLMMLPDSIRQRRRVQRRRRLNDKSVLENMHTEADSTDEQRSKPAA